MANRRDDFSQTTKDLLAKRVAYRCSNPDCGKSTIGPSSEDNKTINIGVAAHICAAAFGGKRYNVRMTREERSHADNGIWLCQSCSKLIDSDAKKYTVELLHRWKKRAEEQAEQELRCRQGERKGSGDIENLKFYLLCMDRPAFQDSLQVSVRRHDHRLKKFYKAIEDTTVAFNTGVLRDRDGNILKQGGGKALIQNDDWREKLGRITRILTRMRNEMDLHRDADGQIIADWEFVEELEELRREAIDILNALCREAGIKGLTRW